MEEEILQTYTVLEQQLITSIKDCIQNQIGSNAVFLAERLVAEKDNEYTRNLLAESYMVENKAHKAYHILLKCTSEQNRYKLALACIKLNKYKEAEKALIGNFNQQHNQGINYNSQLNNVPNGAYGFYLLGIVCERLYKQKDALQNFQRALDLNPTLWTAYEKICKLGEKLNPIKVFNENHYKQYENTRNAQVQQIQNQIQSITDKNQQNRQQDTNEQSRIKGSAQKGNMSQSGIIQNNQQQQQPNQQNYGYILDDNNSQTQQQNQGSYHKKNLSLGGYIGGNLSSSHNFTNLLQNNSFLQQNQNQQQQQQQQPPQSISTLYPANNNFRQQQQQQNFFANSQLSASKKNNQVKCFMEIVKYSEAEKYFSQAFTLEPYRLEGLEYYSSCLWQQKKQVELCWLAHHALEISLFQPETWITVGNCFSLNKENENSLKFFNRAIQLNKYNPYSYCLCGHEYIYNEDFQRARRCFDQALTLDVRHYNAWWGIGNIYYKQEKYDRARENFQKSIEINKKNPVLYSFMAMTLSAKSQYDQALEYFKESEILDANNGLNRFQKANVLVKLERYDEALAELIKLYQVMPREAPIPMLIGQIYKKKNDVNNAMRYFNLALDLESKDQQRIKALIQGLHNNQGDFQEELDI